MSQPPKQWYLKVGPLGGMLRWEHEGRAPWWDSCPYIKVAWGFCSGSDGKDACNAETQVQSQGWEDPLEEGNGNLLQYSCLGNPLDRGIWQVTVLGGHKESDITEQLTLSLLKDTRQLPFHYVRPQWEDGLLQARKKTLTGELNLSATVLLLLSQSNLILKFPASKTVINLSIYCLSYPVSGILLKHPGPTITKIIGGRVLGDEARKCYNYLFLLVTKYINVNIVTNFNWLLVLLH